MWAALMKPYDLLSPLLLTLIFVIMLHFAGQFKVHTQANIYMYLYTAVSDGYFKRIVGFKALSHVSLL